MFKSEVSRDLRVRAGGTGMGIDLDRAFHSSERVILTLEDSLFSSMKHTVYASMQGCRAVKKYKITRQPWS